jgi:hypothetical protein
MPGFLLFLDEFKDTQEGVDIEGDNEGGWDVDDEDLDLPDLVSKTQGLVLVRSENRSILIY